MSKAVQHIDDVIEEKARTDAGFAIAYALLKLASAQERTARATERLGVNDAATQMGAVEMLAMEVRNGAEQIALALQEIASATEGADGG